MAPAPVQTYHDVSVLLLVERRALEDLEQRVERHARVEPTHAVHLNHRATSVRPQSLTHIRVEPARLLQDLTLKGVYDR